MHGTPEALWSVGGLVAAVVAVIFVGDLLVLAVTERWWQHRVGVWTEIFIDNVALSAFCATVLVPVLRGWRPACGWPGGPWTLPATASWLPPPMGAG